MEESETRRERLKAMRVEAAKSDVSVELESSGMVSRRLSNPLIENEPTPSMAAQYSRPRFDYYTDPMSAFSSEKRRNNFLHPASQGYSSMPPNMTLSPGQRPSQATRDHHCQSSSLRTPMGAAGPLSKPQENMSNTWGGSYNCLNYNYPPNMQAFNFPNSKVGQGDSPHAVHSWGRGGSYNNSPRPQLHSHQSPDMLDVNVPNSGVEPGYYSPHGVHSWCRGGSYNNSPRPQLHSHQSPDMLDVNVPNSGVEPGYYSPDGVHGWGRGGRYSNSPRPQLLSHHNSPHGSGHYSDWRRGRGRSLGSGPTARRGKDSRDTVSAELRPDLYYSKDMLEDPWKGMTPVIWKGPNCDGSWLPKSVSMKKARPTNASRKSVSQPSLAEYLAKLSDTINQSTHEGHEQSEVSES